MAAAHRLLIPFVLGWTAAALRAGAQAAQATRTATVAVSLRVLPQATVEGAGTSVTAEVVPGQAVRIAPSAGARVRIASEAATHIVVSGTPLVGPGGVALRVRFVCAFGGGMRVSAAEPFDCVDGVVAGLDRGHLSWMPIAVGAEVSAAETVGLPAGVYAGRVTLTATHAAY